MIPDINKVINHLKDCHDASRPENMWCFVRKDIIIDILELLKAQAKVMGQSVAITTMHDLPEGCYDNCPLCHDGYCLGLSVSDSGWPYQPAQEVRPYNCPLEIKETD